MKLPKYNQVQLCYDFLIFNARKQFNVILRTEVGSVRIAMDVAISS